MHLDVNVLEYKYRDSSDKNWDQYEYNCNKKAKLQR